MHKLTQREKMAYSTIAKLEAEIARLLARIAELESHNPTTSATTA